MKLRRILTVVLMLCVIASAFAVVSFAQDGETALTPYENSKYNKDFTANAEGDILSTKNRRGVVTVKVADNGNKYAHFHYVGPDGDSGMWDFDISAPSVYANNIVDYPYFVFDFDIMTENGTFDGVKVNPRLYATKEMVGNTSGSVGFVGAITISDITGISTTPYEWQHLTLVVVYNGDSSFTKYVYLNGELAKTDDNKDMKDVTEWKALAGDYSKTRIRAFRMSPDSNDEVLSEVGMDNFHATYLPAGYASGELDTIANYYYQNGEGYELPYGKTVASVTDANSNTTIYDNIDDALLAVGETDTLKLFESVSTPVIIDKNFYLDRNVYDENGNATGALYDFNYESTTGLVATETEEGSGIFTFKKAANAVDVIWDEACEGECDCYAEFGGHKMTATTVVLRGDVPTYFGEIPEFISKDGFVKKFVGWSYTKGGEAAELTAITDADLALGTIKLYPVYTAIQYDLEYTDIDGNSSFYFEDQFDEAITLTVNTNGSKLTLHSDIEFYTKVVLQSGIKSTLDLNGHNLTRINLHGSAYRYDIASGKYVEAEAITSALDAFTATSLTESEFTLTSSKSGSAFKTVSVNGTVWYDKNGRVEKYEGVSAGYAGLFMFSRANSSTVNISNITVHAVDLLYLSDGNTKNFTLNMDGVNFYKTVGAETSGKYGYGCFFIDTVNTVTFNVDNSLFYFPASSVINSNGQLIRMLAKENYTNYFNATFNNCDIISDNSSVAVTLNKTTHSVVFNNCRIYNIKNSDATYPVTFGNDTVSSETIGKNSKAQDGYHIVKASSSKSYSLPTNVRVVIDEETKLPVFNFGFAERTIKFAYETKSHAELYVTVNWLDEYGDLVKVTEALRGSVAEYPEYIALSGDGYRGIKVTRWLDKSGNVSNLAVGDAESYTFKAYPVVDADTEYVAKISEAQLNLLFYTSFRTVLYLPVDSAMEAPTVSGFTRTNVVNIDGRAYYAYYKDNGVTDVTDDVTAEVSFTKDGKSYSQNITVSGLLYAEIVLSYPETDIESRAIANMLRFVKTARIEAGLEISDRFAAAEALYKLDSYKDKNSYDDLGVDTTGLVGYVSDIRFMIHGSVASYLITLDSAVADSATVSLSFADGKQITLTKSDRYDNAYYSSGLRMYDLTDKVVVITVAVGNTTVSGTYSLGSYVKGTGDELGMAMYEFGAAASTYREYLTAKYGAGSADTKYYTATFMADGVVVGSAEFTIASDSIKAPAVPEKNGYTGVWESFGIVNKNIVVNAVYTPITYKITYNVNNSYATHNNPATYTIETDSFSFTAPVSAGDTFLGWYLDAALTVEAPDAVEKGSCGDIILYGSWDCIHDVQVTDRLDPTPLRDGYETTNCVKCRSQERTALLPATKSIKLLAIGNSFSIDALEYFGGILDSAGVENIVIANLYKSGCSVNGHMSNIESGEAAYTLYVYDANSKTMKSSGEATILDGLLLDDWDIITMQQASGHSYKPELYSRLPELIEYVRTYHADAKLYWHMTWSYSTAHLLEVGTFTHSSDMYELIVDAVASEVIPLDVFEKVIPSGTAIQNVRTSYLGDTLNRDGTHLNYAYGRYTAALTWFAYICDVDVDDITYVPDNKYAADISANMVVIKEAVKNAVKNQFSVTESLYPPTDAPTDPDTPVDPTPTPDPDPTPDPEVPTDKLLDLTDEDKAYLISKGLNPDDYKLLKLEMEDDSFYNCKSSAMKKTKTGTLVSGFASTKIFSKEELINGSIIRLTNGDEYKYRPEGWIEKDTNSPSRPGNVSAEHVVIDDAWWGDFNFRAFNVNKSDITLEQAEAAFRIYVPVYAD